MIITADLDLTLIDKERIKHTTRKNGNPAKFYKIVIFLNDNDEVDQYGQSGKIVESINKEETEAGQKGTILGNLKIVKKSMHMPAMDDHNIAKANAYQPAPRKVHPYSSESDDIPF